MVQLRQNVYRNDHCNIRTVVNILLYLPAADTVEIISYACFPSSAPAGRTSTGDANGLKTVTSFNRRGELSLMPITCHV